MLPKPGSFPRYQPTWDINITEEHWWPAWKIFFKLLQLELERESIAAMVQPDIFGTPSLAQAYHAIAPDAPVPTPWELSRPHPSWSTLTSTPTPSRPQPRTATPRSTRWPKKEPNSMPPSRPLRPNLPSPPPRRQQLSTAPPLSPTLKSAPWRGASAYFNPPSKTSG